MKNFIRNFSQFQRVDEQVNHNINHPNGFRYMPNDDEPIFDEEYTENVDDLLGDIANRLYENVKNGTLGNSDTIEVEGKVYPLVSIDIDNMSNKISVSVGSPISMRDYDYNQGDSGSAIFKIISFIVEEKEPGVSVSYRTKGNDTRTYGPYSGFYSLTDSISQYIINELSKGKDRGMRMRR